MKQHDETIILSLIKDDLRNTRLVHGLNNLGLQAGDYVLNIGTSILQLMGFEPEQRTEGLYAEYMDRLVTALEHSAEQGAKEVYEMALFNVEF